MSMVYVCSEKYILMSTIFSVSLRFIHRSREQRTFVGNDGEIGIDAAGNSDTMAIPDPTLASISSNPFQATSTIFCASTVTAGSSPTRKCLVVALLSVLIAVLVIGCSIVGIAPSNILFKTSVVSTVHVPGYRPVTVQQAERMADGLMRSDPESVRPNFIGRKGRARVHNIFWLHIQKCGTSLFNTLYLGFCPSILEKNPRLADRTDLMETSLIRDFPMEEWCGEDVMFYNHPRVGFHWPWKKVHWGIKKKKRGDGLKPQRVQQEFHSFAMFRDPLERIKSAFSFRETTMLDVPFYSKMKDSDISLEEYAAEPHIPNCQIKMVLGHRCWHYVEPSKLDVKEALRRISSPSFYFGLTDRWDESICLFHSWYGGSTKPFELLNNRPTKRLDVVGEEGMVDIVDVDTSFVAGAIRIFDERLKGAGCMASD